ncbi:MAG: GntR family transcriptional regulator [Maricaulaceae bacterium]
MPPAKTLRSTKTWKSLYSEVSRRIAEGVWKPGEIIPGEVELAAEFGCARATVNRALRELAKEGFLDRRRKAGTRVSLHPVRKATLDISITRAEVEQRGHAYSHVVLNRRQKAMPENIKTIMGETQAKPLYLTTLHQADGKPFLYETRWVNIDVIPGVLDVNFSAISMNEWLVNNALFTTGEITFSAANASDAEAKILNIEKGTALFIVERTTWNGPHTITVVRLFYAPGFKMSTHI